MENWNTEYKSQTNNKENTEQRSSSIDRGMLNAEPQRVATMNTAGNLQSSEVTWDPTTRKQNDTQDNTGLLNQSYEQKQPSNVASATQTDLKPLDSKIENTSAPPDYTDTHRKSVPYDETLQFFGDSNATDTKNYPSRSLLDQDSLQRGSVSTMPFAGERRRSSAAPGHKSSATAPEAGSFLPREEIKLTPASNDVPIGEAALTNNQDKISSTPMDVGNQPSTHEPVGFSMQNQKTPGQDSTPRQDPKEHERSYSEMATDAVTTVTATAGAAAAALFGAYQGKSKDTEEQPSATATQSQRKNTALSQSQQDSSVEPAIHGQDACFDSKDECCKECVPDEKHAFCSRIKEPNIHGQQCCYNCCENSEKAQDQSGGYGTATIFGTSAAGVGYLYATADKTPTGVNETLADKDSTSPEVNKEMNNSKDKSATPSENLTNQPLSARDSQRKFGGSGFATGAAAGGAAMGGAALAFGSQKKEHKPTESSTDDPPIYTTDNILGPGSTYSDNKARDYPYNKDMEKNNQPKQLGHEPSNQSATNNSKTSNEHTGFTPAQTTSSNDASSPENNPLHTNSVNNKQTSQPNAMSPQNVVDGTSTTGSGHAFGGNSAFGNRESSQQVPMADHSSTQNYAKVPGMESLKPEGLSSDNAFVKEDSKKNRRGSIKKVMDKLFHKHPSKST